MYPHGAHVSDSSGLMGQFTSTFSQQQRGGQMNLDPITDAVEVNTGYLHCRERRAFYPDYGYEVVTVRATDRNANTPPDTFHILNFPIDKLDKYLMTQATQLSNLRSITFNNPLSWEVFMTNYINITQMALDILTHVSSLTSITLCADMLNDELFRALGSRPYLREFVILLPTISFHFPDRLSQIGEVLNTGIGQLKEVEYLKIPLELVTPSLLSCLSGLPYLNFLKTTGSAGAPYPGRIFAGCTEYLHVQNTRFFGSLQVLDIRDDLPQEDSLSNYMLTKMFPTTKLIKT